MLGRVSTSDGDRLLDDSERPAAPVGIVGGRIGYGATEEHNRRLHAHGERLRAFKAARVCPPVYTASGMWMDLMRIPTVTVTPASDDAQAVAYSEHIEACLGVGRVSPIGMRWSSLYPNLLDSVLDGFGVWEMVPVEGPDGRWYTPLLPRDPATIECFVVDEAGRLVAVEQMPVSGWSPTRRRIPMSQALHLCWRPLSPTDFSGAGVLRAVEPLAGDYTRLCNLRMVAAQRWGVGTPVAVPDIEERDRAGIDPETHKAAGDDLDAALKGYAAHERARIRLTPGWKLEKFGGEPENLASIDALIDSTARRIYEAWCMQFGMLGSAGAGGSYSLGETQARTARDMAQGVCEWLADNLNAGYIPRALRWQFGPDVPEEVMPRIGFDGLASEAFVDELAQIPALVTAGLVREDDAVRDAIRRALELPAEDPNNRPGPPRRNVGAPPLVPRPVQGVK